MLPHCDVATWEGVAAKVLHALRARTLPWRRDSMIVNLQALLNRWLFLPKLL